MDKILGLMAAYPLLKWISIGYFIYHLAGYLLLFPYLYSDKGIFTSLLLFAPSFLPGVKTIIKFHNWGILHLIQEIGTVAWLAVLPFSVGAIIYPSTKNLFAAIMFMFIAAAIIGCILFGFYYDFSILRAMFFPTEDELNDPINFLYDNENIRSNLLNNLVSEMSDIDVSKEDARELIINSPLLSNPKKRPFDEKEKKEIVDFLIKYLGFEKDTEKEDTPL